MQRVARALGTDATRFTEHRLHRLVDRLRAQPGLVDRLYAETVQD
jgi:hypothetical protein